MFLPARLRADDGWRDVTIANVSSRGLMLRCPTPPGRSSFIEVRHRGVCIVGRVVWANGNRAGVRTQDRVDIAELLSQASVNSTKADGDRRLAPRQPVRAPEPSVAARAEASRRWARAFDWIVVAVIGAAAAAGVAGFAQTMLGAPLHQASEAMRLSR